MPVFSQIFCPDRTCPGARIRATSFGLAPGVLFLNGVRRSRFQCSVCKKTFTSNRFALDYRHKHPDPALNQKIFSLHLNGLSNRAISRLLFVSENCIRGRLFKMSRWAFDFHASRLNKLHINETLCMDGLENFAYSQYDPNYINQLVGRDSLFIYDFNFSPMNRKGRMSPWQENRLTDIESVHGRYDPKAIRRSTTKLLTRIYDRVPTSNLPLKLLSDEHFQYRRSLEFDIPELRIEHTTISAKVCRNFQNILFPVNHADLCIRQNIKAFSRETISFSKTAARMCQRFMLFALHKNYMAPQFTNRHVRRPDAHIKSPAELLGIETNILRFSEIFSPQERLKTMDASQKHSEWDHFANDQVPEYCLRSKKFVKKVA
jgi:hypothetical protein